MRTLCSTMDMCAVLALAPLSSHAQQPNVEIFNYGQGRQQVEVSGDLPEEQKNRIKAQIEEHLRRNGSLEGDAVVNIISRTVHSSAEAQLQGTAAGHGKTLVVLDGTPASEEILHEFAQALRAGKVRIRKGSLRKVSGGTPEGAKYGAEQDDTVILIQSDSVSETTK